MIDSQNGKSQMQERNEQSADKNSSDSIDLDIYGTSRVTALPPIKRKNKTLRRPIPGVSYLATSGLLE